MEEQQKEKLLRLVRSDEQSGQETGIFAISLLIALWFLVFGQFPGNLNNSMIH